MTPRETLDQFLIDAQVLLETWLHNSLSGIYTQAVNALIQVEVWHKYVLSLIIWAVGLAPAWFQPAAEWWRGVMQTYVVDPLFHVLEFPFNEICNLLGAWFQPRVAEYLPILKLSVFLTDVRTGILDVWDNGDIIYTAANTWAQNMGNKLWSWANARLNTLDTGLYNLRQYVYTSLLVTVHGIAADLADAQIAITSLITDMNAIMVNPGLWIETQVKGRVTAIVTSWLEANW